MKNKSLSLAPSQHDHVVMYNLLKQEIDKLEAAFNKAEADGKIDDMETLNKKLKNLEYRASLYKRWLTPDQRKDLQTIETKSSAFGLTLRHAV
ncbi:MAG: hypothetical protein JWM56_701 [Candidatus Peribacteria bacterium]|nr:hypothetical protein [Candidatus Peribacteria bacterium]